MQDEERLKTYAADVSVMLERTKAMAPYSIEHAALVMLQYLLADKLSISPAHGYGLGINRALDAVSKSTGEADEWFLRACWRVANDASREPTDYRRNPGLVYHDVRSFKATRADLWGAFDSLPERSPRWKRMMDKALTGK